MFTTLARKSWTDLRRRPARAVLTGLTISLAVASFGILAMPSLMDRAMSSEIAKARLYDLSVPVDDVVLSQAQMAGLAKLPNVVAVSGRSSFGTRVLIGARRVDTEISGRARLRRPGRRSGDHDQPPRTGPGIGGGPGRIQRHPQRQDRGHPAAASC